ncbi:FKBP-type peptidyl-prolyl cis-trans isomerase [Aeromicrobium stalagmiti]|uniref:FKBP-type peptidyl-prolyl cis-trans isomerase n=1 Tax=Aeromicrobium stalagmiti TaxID=2738988 RepID=UPI00156A1182|nr:FKBP-type peptidyl-prolyl cis-trans isomerase [Aeromicrobium stalagmiti]
MRRILLASVAASLVLAGCGGSDDGGSADLSAVKVSDAKTPKVTVTKGFKVTKTESKVLKEGSGDELKEGDSVKLDYVGVNGTTGKLFDSTYAAAPQTISLSTTTILAGFVKGLDGRKVGSRVLVAIPPKDGFGATGQPSFEIKKADTMVLVFDIVSKVPTEVTGTSKKLPSDVPQIKLDGDKHPSGFTTSGKTKKKVSKEALYTVIKGDGAKIEKGQTLTAQYVGQVYPDGKVFDESWSKAPASFPVGTGGLIACWDDLLVGQPIGSRVVLVCPADKAYGDAPQGDIIKKGDTLIFAIDLLDAS